MQIEKEKNLNILFRWLNPLEVDKHTRDISILAYGTRGSYTKVSDLSFMRELMTFLQRLVTVIQKLVTFIQRLVYLLQTLVTFIQGLVNLI